MRDLPPLGHGTCSVAAESALSLLSPPKRHRPSGRDAGQIAALAAIVVWWPCLARAQGTDPGATPDPPAGAASAATVPPQPPPEAAPPAAPPRRPLGKPTVRDPFTWRYPEFRPSEYAATGIFAAMAIGGLLIPTSGGRWTGENGLDSGVRDALRLDGAQSRQTADDVSDVTLVVLMNHVAFDATVVAWWGRDKGSVAYQMAAIDVETLAVTAGVTSLVKGIAARERPYSGECDEDPVRSRTDDCDDDSLNRSFFSGHTSTAFAAASLTCMHHAYLDLYDSAVGDAVACISAYGLAGTTGVLRIMSDNHYASDVATGAVVGTVIGLGLPWVLHYREEIPEEEQGKVEAGGGDLSITFVPGPTSGTLVGTF
jgi:membrane-associated phospholipid phosphatase